MFIDNGICMLGSNCKNCCFLDKEKRVCTQQQFSVDNGDAIFAPGFCRRYRSDKWAENKNGDKDLTSHLIEDSEFKYDLVLIYNEQNLDALDSSVRFNSLNSFCENIIICDVNTNRSTKERQDIIQWFSFVHKNNKFCLDISAEKEDKVDNTIKRINRLIKNRYFVVSQYKKIFSTKENVFMSSQVSLTNCTRFIYWPFKNNINLTSICPYNQQYGLYIDDAYKKLTQGENNFLETLRKEEQTTGISLSCYIDVVT